MGENRNLALMAKKSNKKKEFIINNWEKATGHKIKNPESNITGTTKKVRAKNYDPKLSIQGSFEDVIKVSVTPNPKKPEPSAKPKSKK